VLSLMTELQKATGELIGLGIQNDINIQYLKVIYPSHALPYIVPEGNLCALTQSAGGWMLLSQLPPRKLDYTIRRVNLAAVPENRVNVQEFIERIAQVKRDGHAYAENIPFEHAATLCVSLPIALKGQPAVLGVSGHLDDIQPRRKELTELLRHGANLLRSDEPIGDLTQFGRKTAPPASQARRGQAPAPGRWFDALGQFDDTIERTGERMPAHG
jgi:DNA-binding IclR family transcriptional regulator